MRSARDEILGKLKEAGKREIPGRPHPPPMQELPPGSEEVVKKFIETFTAETGVLFRVRDTGEARGKLTEVAAGEGLRSVMVSTDSAAASLDLPGWGRDKGIAVMTAHDFPGREGFKDAVFDKVQAGITGADFAVAESGTLGLIHDREKPRLISLAPILHIAILPRERVYSTYEPVMKEIFRDGAYPGQFVFITGPSMTGDIRGELFRGIHGPRKVVVILIG